MKAIDEEGVICLNCKMTMEARSITRIRFDRYNRETRSYFGWCNYCNYGLEVVQFRQDGQWLLHKYRSYRYVGNNPLPVASRWYVLNQMPEPAPILTGPGGDFAEPYTPQVSQIRKLLDQVQDIIAKAAESVKTLIKDID